MVKRIHQKKVDWPVLQMNERILNVNQAAGLNFSQ